MILKLQNKKTIVSLIQQIAQDSLFSLIIDFRGITGNQMNAFRKEGRKFNINMHVVRNTLVLRAIQNTSFSCLQPLLIGPTLLVFSKQGIEELTNFFKVFSKGEVNFQIKAMVYNGKIVPPSKMNNLMNLPTYKEAIIKLILIIRELSIGKLLRIFMIYRKYKEIQ